MREKSITFAELEAAYKKDPDDRDIAARLAAEYLRRDKPDDAKKLVDAIRAKRRAILFGVLLSRQECSDVPRTMPVRRLYWKRRRRPTRTTPRVLAELGKLYFDLKDYEAAAATFERGREGRARRCELARCGSARLRCREEARSNSRSSSRNRRWLRRTI